MIISTGTGRSAMITQAIPKPTGQAAERARLRRELLRLILKNEERRKAEAKAVSG